jgi:protein-tyrosine kinase
VEQIKEALKKAKASGDARVWEVPEPAPLPQVPVPARPSWSPPRLVLDPKHLELQKIVSYAMTDPSHHAFNLLRTKVYKAMKANGWRSLAVLSPTVGCGKTTVSLNLAFTMARAGRRTVLMDLDLKKAAMAKMLGAQAKRSIGMYLEGKAEAEDCFVQITENLFAGINADAVKCSSELLQDERLNELLVKMRELLRPDVIIFDLPPMLSSDDAIAFLPRVDCSLLVIGAGTTTAKEVDECELQASAAGNYLGVVLNKCQSTEYYQYDY